MSQAHTLYLEEIYGFAANNEVEIPEAATIAYGQALLAVCGADGLGPQEKAYFDARHDAIGLPPSLRAEMEKFDYANASIPQIIGAFTAAMKGTAYGEGGARSLLYDAIRIASKDHVYSPEEKVALRKVAHELGVAEATVTALESLVEEEVALRNKRLSLLWVVAPATASS
jgi:hypothetical protein